ncbi:hypothetical protein PIB30_047871 [Stylosanthes scabra]|uniref:Uncharacterized protein n=1 Tax=Stylosanthes scabra TaxID=79078 RepID=A0ABU6WGS5_9FABA|nr:hypothetical protein [Stylosanthes scabra]
MDVFSGNYSGEDTFLPADREDVEEMESVFPDNAEEYLRKIKAVNLLLCLFPSRVNPRLKSLSHGVEEIVLHVVFHVMAT